MKHNLKITISKKPQTGGLVTYRNVSVRERILRLLLGSKQRVTILVPGDSIEEISICEVTKGRDKEETSKN